MAPSVTLIVDTLCTDEQGLQRAKASMRLRIRGGSSGDASFSSTAAGGDQQSRAAGVVKQVPRSLSPPSAIVLDASTLLCSSLLFPYSSFPGLPKGSCPVA